jgi:hypothetical protein
MAEVNMGGASICGPEICGWPTVVGCGHSGAGQKLIQA